MGRQFTFRFPARVRRGLSRRDFLRQASAASALIAATPLLQSCGSSGSPPADTGTAPTAPPPAGTFQFKHGVASGDPYPESVVLWTRVTPGSAATIPVTWSVYRDTALTQRVTSGSFTTSEARDYTVKVVPTGLSPATTYYFQFAVGSTKSPVGRTRTAPAINATVERLRFAMTSCAWLTQGYFNGYKKIAQRLDLDAVFTLGDYLYEYGPNDAGGTVVPGRTFDPPREMTTLADYRLRHANYKSDADLQQAHRQHPWICVWDDHESTNDSNTTGAQNHTEGTEGKWSDRKGFSIKAYFEWMPVRDEFNPQNDATQHLYRRLRYGALVDIFMLDTRLEGRDPAPANAAAASGADRRIMSARQETFLLDGLLNSTAKWKLVGQQTMISQLMLTPGQAYTLDSWDGYVAQRNRIFDFIGGANSKSAAVKNVVVLTGDIHTAFACELTKDPASTTAYMPGVLGSVAVEMVCPSISSVGFPEVNSLKQMNRHMRYAEASGDAGHGYTVLDITPARCQGEWFFNATVLQPSDIETTGINASVWKTDDGKPFLSAGTASVAPANPPAAAP